MTSEQSMMQALTQAATDAAKAVINATREAKDPFENARTAEQTLRGSRTILKQLKFDRKTPDK